MNYLRIKRDLKKGCTPKKDCAKFMRQRKIQYKASRLSDYSLSLTPLLVLSGVWFQNAGFSIGEVVTIEVLEGKIIITNPLPF